MGVVTAKYQVTIPLEIRRAAGIGQGDRVAVSIHKNGVLIVRDNAPPPPDSEPAMLDFLREKGGGDIRAGLRLAVAALKKKPVTG